MLTRKTVTVVYVLDSGKMRPLSTPKNPELANFVICCNYGDWSGFRVLSECIKQFPALEQPRSNKPDGWYWVEER